MAGGRGLIIIVAQHWAAVELGLVGGFGREELGAQIADFLVGCAALARLAVGRNVSNEERSLPTG